MSSTGSGGGKGLMLGADDFLPLFVWVLVQSGMIAAEIEAEYMWGLLHPSLLSGEGGYYLTTLSSAVHVLKNFRASEPAVDVSHPLDSYSELDSSSDCETVCTLTSSHGTQDSGFLDTSTSTDTTDCDACDTRLSPVKKLKRRMLS